MRVASIKLKTIFYVPTHSPKGAIAATRLLKTNKDLPRRAARWEAEASARHSMKTKTALLKPLLRGWLANVLVESKWNVWATPRGEHEDAHVGRENHKTLGVFTRPGGSPSKG
jgi:hypothetical protein